MDAKTFREFGKAAVDFVADYMENIREWYFHKAYAKATQSFTEKFLRSEVLPSVTPGYLFDLLPAELPENSEDWSVILQDINRYIKPGITHWQSPNFHAFYPTACSYPSIVGEMLAAGFSVIGFNWICSPACTELEVVVMDWLAKFLKLPTHFLHSTGGPGGGIIQGSASEAVLVAVIAAREQAVRRFIIQHPEMSESDIRGKLIAYSSDQSNSCIEKAGVLAAMPVKLLPTDQNFVMHGEVLKQAVEEDLAKGLLPVICIATLGTTGTCSYDDIESLVPICQQHNIWLHVDAAYAGAAFALEECEHLRRGLNEVDSLNFNLHKFLMVNFDCGAMWLKDARKVVDSFNVDRIYLKHEHEGQSQIPDFRHWQIPLGRRFRALKVWITFRSIGAEGLRAHVRKHMALAERFENHVLADERFEIVSKRTLGLVCFRVTGENGRTTALLQRITDRKKLYMVQAAHRGKHFLRFVVCGMDPKEEDVDFAWSEIQSQLTELLRAENLVPAAQQESIFHADNITGKGEMTLSQELSSGLHIGTSATEKTK